MEGYGEVSSSSECKVRSGCAYIKAAALVLGLSIVALILRDGMLGISVNAPFISVKGLAEKVVMADSAIWVIPINSNAEELSDVKNKMDADGKKIIEYLKKHNVKDAEIEMGTIRVYDKMAQRYYNDANKAPRFSAEQNIVVKTTDVEAVQKASLNVNELLSEGVVLSYDGYNSTYAPQYLFTKLNEIKPEMLSEAIKAAHKAAQHLLEPEKQEVGKIKHVSQGMFSVYSREAIGTGPHIDQRAFGAVGNKYSMNEAYFMEKVIRVVATVDYYVR